MSAAHGPRQLRDRARTRLAAQRDALVSLLRGFDDGAARWRPAPGKWSMVEIACHLVDEERDDFRARLRRTLESPDRPWDPIDPEGWVVEREYASRDPARAVEEFVAERDSSLLWLGELDRPDWEATHRHPQLGAIRAGDLLCAWVAHDLFHIRQLVRLQYALLESSFAEYRPGYAGPWTR